MVRSYERGHKIEVLNDVWVYSDTKEPVIGERPCVRCKREPTEEGHDGCLGILPGVEGACCGHSVGPSHESYVKLIGCDMIYGDDALKIINILIKQRMKKERKNKK